MDCSICFNNIEENKKVTTNCNHSFCYDCLNEWFKKDKISCPICRKDIIFYQYNNEKFRIFFINRNQREIDDLRLNLRQIQENITTNNNTINIKKIKYILLNLAAGSSFIFMSFNIYLVITDCEIIL